MIGPYQPNASCESDGERIVVQQPMRADLAPFCAIAELIGAEDGELVEQVSAPIGRAKAFTATQVDAELTLRSWYNGRSTDVAVLWERRAGHNQEPAVSLARQLTSRYSRYCDRTNAYRMVQFSQQLTEPELAASPAQLGSWTHFRELLPLATDAARGSAVRVREIIDHRFSVHDLCFGTSRKAFEPRGIADSQVPEGSAIRPNSLRRPMLLDMFALADTFSECGLETALRHDIEAFLLEVGLESAVIECQNRMRFGSDDYHPDLLFYSRPLPGLIALELKVGMFVPSYQGQMDFYSKGPNRNERQPDESRSVGHILCIESSCDRMFCCSNYARTGSLWRSIGRRSYRRRRFGSVSKQSTGMRRGGSLGGSSPQRRKKTSMIRDWPTLDAASSAARSGF